MSACTTASFRWLAHRNAGGTVGALRRKYDRTVTNLSPSVTVWVQGRGSFGDAILNLSSAASNDGTILLESSNNTYQSNIATGSSTLTNLGTIKASLGSGGNRIISGTLNNQGTISADSNDYLEITGTYQAQGGTTTGPAELYVCKLFETASPASASTIVIAGTGDTLESNNLAGYTLWVNGNGLFNTDAILNLGANVSNRGAILLESSNNTYQSNIATGSSTLTNLGTITSSLGTGGNRIISGTLNNQATISVDPSTAGLPVEITGAVLRREAATIDRAGRSYLVQLHATTSTDQPRDAHDDPPSAGGGDVLATDNLPGHDHLGPAEHRLTSTRTPS